jgi:hypothetical protein
MASGERGLRFFRLVTDFKRRDLSDPVIIGEFHKLVNSLILDFMKLTHELSEIRKELSEKKRHVEIVRHEAATAIELLGRVHCCASPRLCCTEEAVRWLRSDAKVSSIKPCRNQKIRSSSATARDKERVRLVASCSVCPKNIELHPGMHVARMRFCSHKCYHTGLKRHGFI